MCLLWGCVINTSLGIYGTNTPRTFDKSFFEVSLQPVFSGCGMSSCIAQSIGTV